MSEQTDENSVAGGVREPSQWDAAGLAGPPSGHGPGYRGIAGHCHDIDGNLWHAPGECPGAVINCNGDCCALMRTSTRSHLMTARILTALAVTLPVAVAVVLLLTVPLVGEVG